MTKPLPTITVPLVDGTRLVVNDSLEQITPYVLQEQGDWFEDELPFLRLLLQPGQSVVDIGASVGAYALSLARRVGPEGKVWAFEPASATAELLAAGIEANGTSWVQLQRQAMSDHEGTARLKMPMPGQPEGNYLAEESTDSNPTDCGAGEEVPLTTLDACLEAFGWSQVDLLKIDAKGEEERILAGGQRFFRELSPLVMFEMQTGGALRLELVEQFVALGYACFRLVPSLGALMPFDSSAGVDGYLLNLFAAKPDRAAALAAGGWLVQTATPQPPEAADLKPYHWSRSLSALPYSQVLAPIWRQQPQDTNLGTASEVSLELWAFSQDASQPLDRRLGALQHSYQLLHEQTTPGCPLPRWASLARVARALGERTMAVRALGHLIPVLEEGVEPDLSVPFLAPLPRYDNQDPGGHLSAWLASAALEADELHGEMSGFYMGVRSRPRLERLLELGFSNAEDAIAQRRMDLLKRRFPRLPTGSPEQENSNEAQLSLSKRAWEQLQAGNNAAALPLLREARQMGIDCSSSLHYIAKSLVHLGSLSEATALLQRAVELNPNDASLVVELGLTLQLAGETQAGVAVLQQAVLLYGLLLAYSEGGAADFANLGIAYDALAERDNALACLEQALDRDPTNESALLRKASILGTQADHHEEADAIWKQMLSSENRHLGALAQTIVLRVTQGELSEAERLLKELLNANPNDSKAHHLLAFLHSISGEPAVAAHLSHLRSYWHQVRSLAPQKHCAAAAFALPPTQGRLRVGILSAEIGDHVVSLFLEPFLRHYDRQLLEVELIEVKHHHTAWADELRALADAVISLHSQDREEARRHLRSRSYHVLVETSGLTKNSGIELLAERLAPVQCHYIGFHASTGLDTIDWFIGDEITAAPELAAQFVERLWRLPRTWLACSRLPELPDALSTLGSSAPVLGSFNQFGKIREETLAFWAEAMLRTPSSELHLKSVSSDSAAPRQRISQGLERHGVDPGRVRFLERTANHLDHLRCYNSIDVALDATPWAGATTSFEALSMGVPVVGILGGTTAGRMTCSILRGLGRNDWIASTPTEFAGIVRQLAAEVTRLRADKSSLQREVLASSLFDGSDLARHLQDAFLSMAKAR